MRLFKERCYTCVYLLAGIMGTPVSLIAGTTPFPQDDGGPYYDMFIAALQGVIKGQLGEGGLGDDWTPSITGQYFTIGEGAVENITATNALTYPRIDIKSGSSLAQSDLLCENYAKAWYPFKSRNNR